jgi:hypothetical protein
MEETLPAKHEKKSRKAIIGILASHLPTENERKENVGNDERELQEWKGARQGRSRKKEEGRSEKTWPKYPPPPSVSFSLGR